MPFKSPSPKSTRYKSLFKSNIFDCFSKDMKNRIIQLKIRHGVQNDTNFEELNKKKNSLTFDNSHSKSHSAYMSWIPERSKSRHKNNPSRLIYRPSLEMYNKTKSSQGDQRTSFIHLSKNVEIL